MAHTGFLKLKFEPLLNKEGSPHQGDSDEWKYPVISQVPRVEWPKHSKGTAHLFLAS